MSVGKLWRLDRGSKSSGTLFREQTLSSFKRIVLSCSLGRNYNINGLGELRDGLEAIALYMLYMLLKKLSMIRSVSLTSFTA